MKKIFLIVACVLCVIGLVSFIKKPVGGAAIYPPVRNIMYIQPLGDVDIRLIRVVDSTIQVFYHYNCVILQKVSPTEDILTPSRTKYDVNKVITKFSSQYHILLLTEKNISYKFNDQYPEWGCWGMAQMRGKTAVGSTYMIKDKNNWRKTANRLIKVVLHEVGHNMGLQHCNRDKRCFMNDGSDGLRELDAEDIWLCNNCRAQLKN